MVGANAFGQQPPAVPEIDTANAAKVHGEGGAVFVDVREADEWAEGHIPGALHIPLADVPQRMAEIPADRDVILVCRSGARSHAATEFLVRGGRKRVANLVGGMLAWADARHPVTR